MPPEESTHRSIEDVLVALRAEDDGNYVYRGQTRDYGVIVPSALRHAVARVDGATVVLDRRRLVAGETVRARQQSAFRNHLVRQLGSLGQIFAQQYGVASDLVDVTSSPMIAAFFATRSWPTYTHVRAAASPGIVYRWRRPDPPRTPEELKADMTFGLVRPEGGEDSERVNATASFPARGTMEHVLARDAFDAWLTLPSMIVTFDEIGTAMDDHLAQEHGGYAIGWQFEGFERSRWRAQQGGFLRPDTLYAAHLGPPPTGGFQLEHVPEYGEHRLNRRPLAEQPSQFTDPAQIGAPDRFLFHHGDHQVDVSPASLWPSALDDPMFAYMAIMAWTGHEAYFDQVRANYPWDQVSGLLDRGPYPEQETETYQRGEYEIFQRLLRKHRPT